MSGGFSGLWRHRDFMKLWAGQSISEFGSRVGGTALQFTAVLVLKATPLEMGLLAAAAVAPGFAAGLVTGVWVDRLPRRPLLIAADLGRALLLLTVPLAALLHRLSMVQLYGVACLTSLLTIVFDIAYQTYLPTLVGADEITDGNGKLAASASIAEVTGFGGAGWLIQLFTAPLAVLVDAISFLFSALAVVLIKQPEGPVIADGGGHNMLNEMREGWDELFASPVLRAFAHCTLLKEVGGGMIGTTIVLYTSRQLGFAPGVLGMIFGIGGASAFVGALVVGRVTRRFGIGPATLGGLLIASCLGFCIPLAHGASVGAAVLLIIPQLFGDGSHTLYDVNSLSLRQLLAPPAMLGRINAGMQFMSQGALLVGSLLGGWLGNVLGLRTTLVLAMSIGLVAALGLLLSPVRHLHSPDLETGAGLTTAAS